MVEGEFGHVRLRGEISGYKRAASGHAYLCLKDADAVIDVLRPVDEVVYEITKCQYILTSSLHALIVAQAFGIPAQRLAHPRVLGGDTKWRDYATGYTQGDPDIIEHILRGL